MNSFGSPVAERSGASVASRSAVHPPAHSAHAVPHAVRAALPPPASTAATIGREIAEGLNAPSASISPKFLYDKLGSTLFAAICELPEYYPTRTEAAIIARYKADMCERIGAGGVLIDLGAGDCQKAASLFGRLHPAQYAAVDISAEFVELAVARLQQQFPAIDMCAVSADFSQELILPDHVGRERRTFFYPGSSIGNYTPPDALALLRRIRQAAGSQADGGGLLIGVDLVKESAVLNAAYDDAIGVTAAFNLNVLRHVNRLLGSNFSPPDWRHRGFYNAQQSRIEMHLEARHALEVNWPDGGRRCFAPGETIHTESSYKYTPEQFCDVLRTAGFTDLRYWTDEREWFMVVHARAE